MVWNKSLKISHRLSKIFQPLAVIPKDAHVKHHEFTSKSQKLMLDLGIIKQASPGCYHFLPLGVKSLEKLTKLVDCELKKIGGQKIIFPTLTNSKLWEVTGRLKTVSSELFKLKDRHDQEYILSPTHEEAASELLASVAPISYKQLPLRLYQITSKYRDEMKPRFGLMRGKEFLMKDMYSFDIDVKSSQQTYHEVCNCYDEIFKKIGVKSVKVLGDSGHMGGTLSHEYHYKAEIGEDKILTCPQCNFSGNLEVTDQKSCPECGNSNVDISLGIEIGHTFLLGDKYTKPFASTYLTKNGKPETIQMGSYGLGLSRILAAAIEVLSSDQEIRWPQILAPYNVIIIPPKGGSKEEIHLKDSSTFERLYQELETINDFRDNVLLDDRTSLTIGRRYLEAKKMGYPYIIVIGSKITEDPPLFELTDLHQGKQIYLSEADLLSYIKNSSDFFAPVHLRGQAAG